MTINKGGRPTSMTQDVLNKLENAFSLGCSDEEACFYAEISPATLYNYQNSHPEFLERKNLLKERLVLMSRQVVADALAKDDRDMAKWYLEKKKKAEFSSRIENTGANGEPMRVKYITLEEQEETNKHIDEIINAR